jgi:hypothetical protein
MTSKDFAMFIVALLNNADEELPPDPDEAADRHVAGPSRDPAERLPARD